MHVVCPSSLILFMDRFDTSLYVVQAYLALCYPFRLCCLVPLFYFHAEVAYANAPTASYELLDGH
jgi:hypothetical protein